MEGGSSFHADCCGWTLVKYHATISLLPYGFSFVYFILVFDCFLFLIASYGVRNPISFRLIISTDFYFDGLLVAFICKCCFKIETYKDISHIKVLFQGRWSCYLVEDFYYIPPTLPYFQSQLLCLSLFVLEEASTSAVS